MTLKEIEKAAILASITKYEGNITHVAQELGVSIRTIYNKRRRYQREGELLEILYPGVYDLDNQKEKIKGA